MTSEMENELEKYLDECRSLAKIAYIKLSKCNINDVNITTILSTHALVGDVSRKVGDIMDCYGSLESSIEALKAFNEAMHEIDQSLQ